NNMSVREYVAKGKVKKNMIELPFYDQTPTTSSVEYEPDQDLFTQRLGEYSLEFIKEHRKEPFFLYLANPMPHVPLYASSEFVGRSKRGLYGDTVEEIDHYVGRILDYLRDTKLDRKTLVVFSSDNGAWLDRGLQGGTAMPLRDGKGTMYEGGFRVPGIFWGTGVKPQLVTDIGSTLDLLPTICAMANIPLDSSKVYDGYNI
ncbi:MAG: sulfatase-like hydrolase/transferase, partial [Rikenellaceae bacterium]